MSARENQPEAASATTYESFCKMEFNRSYWQARQQEAEASKAEQEEQQEQEQEKARGQEKKKEREAEWAERENRVRRKDDMHMQTVVQTLDEDRTSRARYSR